MARLVGWRYGLLIGSLFGGIGVCFYAVAIGPYLNIDKWSKFF